MTSCVKDNALLLEVLAGRDGYDGRQTNVPFDLPNYTEALKLSAKGVKVGILKEGFEVHNIDERTKKVVMAACNLLKTVCDVQEVSVPLHSSGQVIWAPILDGCYDQMHRSPYGTGMKEVQIPGFVQHCRKGLKTHSDGLADTYKISLLMATHSVNKRGGEYYAKARCLVWKLSEAYNSALKKVDVLVLPTLPFVATKLPEKNCSRGEYIMRAFEMIPNTAPFNATGHPAFSIPCGMIDGLPVGLMLVGNYFEEATLYRVAHAFESMVDWKELK